MSQKGFVSVVAVVGLAVLVLAGGYLWLKNEKVGKESWLREPTDRSSTLNNFGSLVEKAKEVASSVMGNKTTSKANNFLLEISSPKNGEVVKQNKVTVKGKTIPGAEVFVNDQQVSLDNTGNFSAAVSLDEGENFIIVSAGNERGDKEVEIGVTYEP